MPARNTRIRRIHLDLDRILQNLSRKNDKTITEASRDLARIHQSKVGTKVQDEILF